MKPIPASSRWPKIPSAADRLLTSLLGTARADLIKEGVFGVIVATRGDSTKTVPLEKMAGTLKIVPLDHSSVESARRVGT